MDKETLFKEATKILNEIIGGSKTMKDLTKFLEDNTVDES